jgi:predicted DNA-binding antitoxin AbrB/MazE fold protein
MALKVDASFENGVFVPVNRPGLAERERVRLTVEPVADAQADSKGFSHRDDFSDLASRTGLTVSLDFHPDGC